VFLLIINIKYFTSSPSSLFRGEQELLSFSSDQENLKKVELIITWCLTLFRYFVLHLTFVYIIQLFICLYTLIFTFKRKAQLMLNIC